MKGGVCSRPDLGFCSPFLLEQQQLKFSPTSDGLYFTFSHVNKPLEIFLLPHNEETPSVKQPAVQVIALEYWGKTYIFLAKNIGI